ncbi:type II toxin-antitoxin system RelE/ParE family toxin [Mucilaginibacter sp.]|uniref:type II toxin-antitoxin system RelE/ParE family toxin n=1 Tax=Mucilaginibacter sp. TaxID=1882438 RepID=UPI0025D8AE9F|nr:type II toxin-antitoxin system RelE/ParE family toxin [Mucilaginibacter sp.]
MTFELRFTPEAEETFDSLASQLQQRWGDTYVAKFEAKVFKALKTIAGAPFLYPVVEETTGIRKCILHKNCSMLYMVNNHDIVIAYFWDNRQDPLF